MELLRWLLSSICTTRCISMITCQECSFVVMNCYNPLTTHVPHHIETSELHCKSIDWFLYDGEQWPLMS